MWKGAGRVCPEGTTENSPTFQRWVWGLGARVPKGRLSYNLLLHLQQKVVIRPFGTWLRALLVPRLKRWAIVNHPSGMRTAKSWFFSLSPQRAAGGASA